MRIEESENMMPVGPAQSKCSINVCHHHRCHHQKSRQHFLGRNPTRCLCWDHSERDQGTWVPCSLATGRAGLSSLNPMTWHPLGAQQKRAALS